MKTLSHRALQIFAVLKEQTTLAWQQPGPAYQNAGAAAMCCQQSLQTLKEAFDSHPPRTTAEKISFFKTIKPLFVAEQLYYNKLYLLHARWPPGSEEKQKEYLRCQLHEVYA